MENIGGTMPEDFEEFLNSRRGEGNVCNEESFDSEKVLEEKGLSFDDACAIQSDVLTVETHNTEAAYSKGVKDGAQLMLHLLEIPAPKAKKAKKGKAQA